MKENLFFHFSSFKLCSTLEITSFEWACDTCINSNVKSHLTHTCNDLGHWFSLTTHARNDKWRYHSCSNEITQNLISTVNFFYHVCTTLMCGDFFSFKWDATYLFFKVLNPKTLMFGQSKAHDLHCSPTIYTKIFFFYFILFSFLIDIFLVGVL